MYESQLGLDAAPVDVIEAVRRIVPADNASLLLSRSLSGLTSDPERTVRELFDRYVVREERFENGWKNGRWHVARPLSLDLVDRQDILRKAAEWTGRVRSLDPARQQTTVVLVVGLPAETAPAELREASQHGFGLLREQLADENIAEVLLESDAAQLADRIVADLAHHDADAE